jgi:hypothetical protein
MPAAMAGFVFCALVWVLCLAGAPVFADPDTAWHLAAGDYILAHRSIPLHDPWSFTAGSETWYNLSWLFDVGVSSLFSAGGFSALYALTLLTFSGGAAFMALQCRARGASVIATLLAAGVAACVIFPGVLARPSLCSFLLTPLFYRQLWRYRTFGLTRDIIWLPALLALWVNLHAGFVLAMAIMALFLIDAAWERDRRRVRGLCLLMAACLPATLLNPYGFRIYQGIYRTMSSDFIQNYIVEWGPVEIGRDWPMTLLLSVLLFVAVVGRQSTSRLPLIDRMLAPMLLIASLASGRHGPIAALLMMPYLSLRLSDLLSHSRLLEIETLLCVQYRDRTGLRAVCAAMVLLSGAFIILPWPRERLQGGAPGFPPGDFPAEEAAYVSLHCSGLRFLNHYSLGGYLVYIWRGSEKVFVDGRASTVYREEVLDDYINFVDSGGYGDRAASIAARYKLDGLIIPKDQDDAGLFSSNPRWQAVFKGTVATIYLKALTP